jgi:hypothetical protein
MLPRFNPNGVVTWDDAVAFYRFFEPSLGLQFAPFRELVASLSASPFAEGLFVYPSVTCMHLAPFDVSCIWETCPGVAVSQIGGGQSDRFRIRFFSSDPNEPDSSVECPADDGFKVVCGLLDHIARTRPLGDRQGEGAYSG